MTTAEASHLDATDERIAMIATIDKCPVCKNLHGIHDRYCPKGA